MGAPELLSPTAVIPTARGSHVQLQDISRVYGTGPSAVTALAGVNVDILPGQFLTVLGPSGCGKSTLLNILAGFDRSTSGTALVDGVPVGAPSAQHGVVFQDTAALFPWLSVAENIAFGLKAAHVPRREAAERVAHTLDLVGLSAFADKWPHQLSGGMRQLVAIARVLVMNARLLLMDEPFAALDAMTRQKMQERLIAIWQRTQVSMLLITHSVDEAIYLGDRVVVLSGRPGTVRADIAIPLPRPRDVTSIEFNRIKAESLSHLGIY